MISLKHISSLHFSATFFIISITLCTCITDKYESCSSLVSCGKIQNIGYPFWGAGRPKDCGHPGLQLECPSNHSDDYPTITLKLREYVDILHNDGDDRQNISFRILSIQKSERNMNIKIQELPLDSTCPIHFTSLDELNFFDYSTNAENISLVYGCSAREKIEDIGFDSVTCPGKDNQSNITAYYVPGLPDSRKNTQFESCNVISVPVLKRELEGLQNGTGELLRVLKPGFEVEFSKIFFHPCSMCEDSGGICGSSNVTDFLCYCKDSHELSVCTTSGKSTKTRVILEIGIPFGIIIFVALNIGICYCKKTKFHSALSRKISSDPVKSDLQISRSFQGIPVFSYNELQKATNNFDPSLVLGDGGFGIVYYGKLGDGREVAVKRLFEKNCVRVGQFKNEIEILTKLRHENLVTLFGCTSRHSRELLLVYEYISNGTVAHHLYGVWDPSVARTFTWTIRMKIAIETATALSYLHDSGIIHRDVKTHNILLDDNFSVKVADFGLSRLFPCNVTHVSTAPQGTPGYLDPEYHKCYKVSRKSDVYSFGVVLIELISSLPAVDTKRHEDEVNLSDYAMKRIQRGKIDELRDRKLGSDFKVKKMTTLVAELAFQCLQQQKEARPSMKEVLEALRKIESIDYEALEAEETHRSIGRRKPSSDIDVDQPLRIMGRRKPSSDIDVDQPLRIMGRRKPSSDNDVDQSLRINWNRSSAMTSLVSSSPASNPNSQGHSSYYVIEI